MAELVKPEASLTELVTPDPSLTELVKPVASLNFPPSSVTFPLLLLLTLSLVPGQTQSLLTWLFSCSPSVSLFLSPSVPSL